MNRNKLAHPTHPQEVRRYHKDGTLKSKITIDPYLKKPNWAMTGTSVTHKKTKNRKPKFIPA